MQLNPPPPRRTSPPSAVAGVSLVELMISIVLGMLLIAALTTVFASTSAARNELERTSRQIENGRFAMELLSDDLRVAGFYGELNVKQLAVPAALPDPCSTTVADWSSAIAIGVQAYDNGASKPACIPSSWKAGTDVLVVRRTSTCEAGVGSCPAANAAYANFQVSKCATESATTPFAIGIGAKSTAPFTLTNKNCTTVAEVRQYLVHIYYISTNNGDGAAIPTLKRLEFNGTAYTESPLVEGIEELNIEYGIDNDNDGAPDAYTANPSTYTYAGCATCTAPINWSNVVSARVSLLARNIETSPNYTDTKTYSLGLDSAGAAVTVTPGGAFRRHAYSGLVRVVNSAERRETP